MYMLPVLLHKKYRIHGYSIHALNSQSILIEVYNIFHLGILYNADCVVGNVRSVGAGCKHPIVIKGPLVR